MKNDWSDSAKKNEASRPHVLCNRSTDKALLWVVLAFMLALLVCLMPAFSANSHWGMDIAHCKAIFTVKHDGLSPVTGWFSNISGSLDYDPKNLSQSKTEAWIETSSLNSGFGMRDVHLRASDFFDVKKYPQMYFKSQEVIPVSPGKFKMVGILTLRDLKKKVVLDCTGPTGPIVDEQKQERIGVQATTKLNRKDFGIIWNREVSPGVFMVADPVDITLEMEFLKVAEVKRRGH